MGESVTFPSNGDQAPGYLAGDGGPGVVVIQEWWGLNDQIRGVADRLAGEGFVALVPDLYRVAPTSEPDEAGKLMMALDLPRAGRDIAGAATYLRSHSGVSGSGVGVIGFCMGGGLALWSATISADVHVAVPFYPAMPWESLSPDWAAATGKTIVMHLAESDGGSAAVEGKAQALRDAGATVALYDYAETEHAFTNDMRPEVYDAAAADLAWTRTLDALRKL